MRTREGIKIKRGDVINMCFGYGTANTLMKKEIKVKKNNIYSLKKRMPIYYGEGDWCTQDVYYEMVKKGKRHSKK
jgi:hypothetical protein